MEEKEWIFKDPKNVAIITTKQIVLEGNPILYVSHDLEDGMWQFLSNNSVETEDAMVIGLEEIYQIDNTLSEISDLPLGWFAWRQCKGQEWVKQEEDKC